MIRDPSFIGLRDWTGAEAGAVKARYSSSISVSSSIG